VSTRLGLRSGKADDENVVLAAIAAMPEPNRAIGERLHAISKTSAPVLSPKRAQTSVFPRSFTQQCEEIVLGVIPAADHR
jgi:hypothetical protein